MAWLRRKLVKGIPYWSICETQVVDGKKKQIILEHIGNEQKLSERVLLNSPSNKIESIKSYSHGLTSVLYEISKLIGLEEVLDSVFSHQQSNKLKRSTSIILAAIHRICEPGSKNAFADWINKTSLPYYLSIESKKLTSQHFWYQMNNIDEDKILEAEIKIFNKVSSIFKIDISKLALDYTNYYTYIASNNTRNTIAQRGKNKQKRYDLRQVSMGVMVAKDCAIPILAHTYKGNTNDQVEFKEYYGLIKKFFSHIDFDAFTLVFDGGSNNKENLGNLEIHYICAFSLRSCKELYNINLEDYTDIKIGKRLVKHYRIKKIIWNEERTCILTYSEALYSGQISQLDKDLNKTIDLFDKFKEKLKNVKFKSKQTKESITQKCDDIKDIKYVKDIIVYEISEDLNIDYYIDENAKNELITKFFGKKLTITDRHEWSTEEILESYYDQYFVENMFKQSKDVDFCNLRPLYHWTDNKIRVHIFICMISLTLLGVLQKILQNEGINLSNDKILEELTQIREGWVRTSGGPKNSVIRMLEDMSPEQSSLWGALQKAGLALHQNAS